MEKTPKGDRSVLLEDPPPRKFPPNKNNYQEIRGVKPSKPQVHPKAISLWHSTLTTVHPRRPMLSRSLCSLARRASSGQKITSIRNITVNKRGFASEPSGKQTNEPSKLSTKPSQTSTPPVAPPSASSAPPSANSGTGPFIAIAAAGALAVGVYALRKQLGIEGPVDAVVSTLTGAPFIRFIARFG